MCSSLPDLTQEAGRSCADLVPVRNGASRSCKPQLFQGEKLMGLQSMAISCGQCPDITAFFVGSHTSPPSGSRWYSASQLLAAWQLTFSDISRMVPVVIEVDWRHREWNMPMQFGKQFAMLDHWYVSKKFLETSIQIIWSSVESMLVVPKSEHKDLWNVVVGVPRSPNSET